MAQNFRPFLYFFAFINFFFFLCDFCTQRILLFGHPSWKKRNEGHPWKGSKEVKRKDSRGLEPRIWGRDEVLKRFGWKSSFTGLRKFGELLVIVPVASIISISIPLSSLKFLSLFVMLWSPTFFKYYWRNDKLELGKTFFSTDGIGMVDFSNSRNNLTMQFCSLYRKCIVLFSYSHKANTWTLQ